MQYTDVSLYRTVPWEIVGTKINSKVLRSLHSEGKLQLQKLDYSFSDQLEVLHKGKTLFALSQNIS